MHEELMSNRKEIETIQQWLAYLEKLHDKLYRSAEEFLVSTIGSWFCVAKFVIACVVNIFLFSY